MSKTYGSESAVARYNRALGRARENRLPAGYPSPQPISAWPPENVELLERYRVWLMGGGTSPAVVNVLHIPTAGHLLGLSLKPHLQLNLESDFDRVMDYVAAKGMCDEWRKNTRCSLEKFRQFLRHEHGLIEVTFRPASHARYCTGLPDWLVAQLEGYCHLRQSGWRAARLKEQTQRFWATQTPLWRWLFTHYAITSLMDLKRQYLLDFVDDHLTKGSAVSTINNLLRCFHAFLLHLQDQGLQIPRALLRVPFLKESDHLPRFLTDEQVRLVRDEMERTVVEAGSVVVKRDALLMRAAVYLLWHGGLRLGEVEELRLEDLDLAGRKLMVRNGKGQKDRAVYLTETAAGAIAAYLPVRGQGTTDHVFLYRHRAVQKDLIRCRIKAAGERVGVQVTPHRLRHTCATQLLNAGCRVMSIQKLLGHRQLDTTLGYARVHDQTVSADYFAAMARVEARLELAGDDTVESLTVHPFARAALLALASRLAEPELEPTTRLELVEQLRGVLNGKVPEPVAV